MILYEAEQKNHAVVFYSTPSAGRALFIKPQAPGGRIRALGYAQKVARASVGQYDPNYGVVGVLHRSLPYSAPDAPRGKHYIHRLQLFIVEKL